MRTLRQRHRAPSSHGALRSCDGMRTSNACAAGVDMGAHAIMAGVPDGDDQQIVRACGPSPAERDSLAAWGIARGSQTVAMASTGVSGMPRCETREARGIPCWVSRAASVPPVPGRTSDG